MSENDDRVDVKSAAHEAMAERWALLHDLRGGTKAMRDARTRWLPQMPREQHEAYGVRLDGSFLFGAYDDTVDKIVSKPFARDVTLKGDIPEPLEAVFENVDLAGRDFTTFAREQFECLWTYGIAHAIVDFSARPVDQEGRLVPATLADIRSGSARPTIVAVPPPSLIGWQSEDSDGGERLVQARIHSSRVVPQGAYGEQSIEEVKVWFPDRWELWRKTDEQDEFVLVAEGAHTLGEVPLYTCYLRRDGFLSARPPLEKLAEKNLEHWQKSSDQNNILRFARVPRVFAAGVSEEDVATMAAVGPGLLAFSPNEAARMEVVEHSGAAISAGATDLERVEQQMEILGLQPFFQRRADSTATGRILDKQNQSSDILAAIRREEQWLETLAGAAATLLGLALPDDFKVDIFSDFGIGERDAKEFDQLITMRGMGEITRETFLGEARRRGRLSEDIDLEREIELVEAAAEEAAEEAAAQLEAMRQGATEEEDEGQVAPDDGER